jgi:hypothetical protein
MATSYPTSLDNFTNPTGSDTLDSATVPHATQHANANDAIEAIEAELGTNPKGTSATVKARLDTLDTTVSGKANTASPTFTGTPLSTTAAADTNTTQIATTAFVVGQGYAKLAGPTFTGTPTLPTGTIAVTQTAGNSTTAVATTAFVTTADNLKANIASPTFTGTVNMPATATTAASIDFPTGTLLTTQNGGTVEYDGSVFYATPNVNTASNVAYGGRGIIPVSQYAVLNANVTLNATAVTAQPIFAAASAPLTAGSLAVAPTTSYMVEAAIYLTKGATSTTVTFSLPPVALSSTTFTASALECQYVSAAANTPTAPLMSYGSATTGTPAVICATANTGTGGAIFIRGVIKINASTTGTGTVIPSITFSAATGATPVILRESYIRFTPIGTNAQVAVGAWA